MEELSPGNTREEWGALAPLSYLLKERAQLIGSSCWCGAG